MCTTLRNRIRSGLAAVLLAAAIASPAQDAGPLYDEFSLTLREGRRTEILGPLFSWERDLEQTTWAVHPLLSVQRHHAVDRLSVEVLYPLSTYDRSGTEQRWQFFQILSWSAGADQDDRITERWTLFPVWFWQGSDDPKRRAWALFPLYGRLERRLFRDEIEFVLFPLWSRTRKRDVVTENWLYPLFHSRYGEGLHGWQFFPVYGREEKAPTWRTNAWGETEAVPGHSKRFIFWPLFLESHRDPGGPTDMRQKLFVPFYAETSAPHYQQRSWGWPLGLSLSSNALTGYRETAAPWPFVVHGDGPGRSTRRFWPLYGSSVTTNQTRSFFLWPLWQERSSRSAVADRHERRVGLIVYRDAEVRLPEGRRLQRSLWPLYTFRQDEDGRSRCQILAPLEPLLPGHPSLERNYSPLWSVWRAESDPATGRASQSLLWNLWRQEQSPQSRKGSLLLGLIRYESHAEQGSRWRLLGLPVAGRPSPNVHTARDPALLQDIAAESEPCTRALKGAKPEPLPCSKTWAK